MPCQRKMVLQTCDIFYHKNNNNIVKTGNVISFKHRSAALLGWILLRWSESPNRQLHTINIWNPTCFQSPPNNILLLQPFELSLFHIHSIFLSLFFLPHSISPFPKKKIMENEWENKVSAIYTCKGTPFIGVGVLLLQNSSALLNI